MIREGWVEIWVRKRQVSKVGVISAISDTLGTSQTERGRLSLAGSPSAKHAHNFILPSFPHVMLCYLYRVFRGCQPTSLN